MDILKPARDEIKTLEKTVADATARLQDLRAFVEAGARLYGLTSINSAPTTPTTRFKKTETSRAKPAAAQNKAAQIVAVVEAALSGGQHAPSKELAEILKQNHIDLGTDPISNLSAYL